MEPKTIIDEAGADCRWPSLSRHWKRVYGANVRRISLDPGFSCPNRNPDGGGGCSYCDPASFAPSSGDERPIPAQLDEAIERGRRRGQNLFAAYFQPRTNTYAPLAELAGVWDDAAARPEVVALCVGTRPDCVPDEVLDLLAGYRERFPEIWLELGLQSANDETLERIDRGHDAATFADGVRRAKARGLLVCAHVILGLPGEDAAAEARTSALLAELHVEGVKLHQLSVIKGTRMAIQYGDGLFNCLTEEEYAMRAAAFVRVLPYSTVLHRLVGDIIGDREIAPKFDKSRVLAAISRLLDEQVRG